MIKKITHNDKVVAIVFKKQDDKDIKEGINFLTNPEEPLQTGILNHPKGHIISPHVHNAVEKKITKIQEMLYVELGKMKVTFFSEDNKKIGEEILEPGDLIVLLDIGHGFEMLENSRLIYSKQGPYINKETDKKLL